MTPDNARPVSPAHWTRLDALRIPLAERERWRLAPAGLSHAEANRWARLHGYERIIELAGGETLARQPLPQANDGQWPGLDL